MYRPYVWSSDSDYIEVYGYNTDGSPEYLRIPTDESVASFWRRHNIRPYEWLDATTLSSKELPLIVPARVAFWDIETYSGRPGMFPDATHPEDAIFLISLILMHGSTRTSYIIMRSSVAKSVLMAEWKAQFPEDAAHLLVCGTEAELLTQFFRILARFQPDRYVYYNGDMFDMPYVLKRAQGLTLPSGISKKIGASLEPVHKSIVTPVGTMDVLTLPLPDVEIIDLLYVYRRLVLPYLPNHRLDTVANAVLGVGKTDLSIEELMNAVRTQDPAALARGIHYSWIDSLRMVELWTASGIANRLETVANRLRVSISALLHEPRLLDDVLFQMDPQMTVGGRVDLVHLRAAVPGIYHRVYVYDYSELYRLVLLRSAARELAARLEGSPPDLILQAFSEFGVAFPVVDEIRRLSNVIAVESTILRCSELQDQPYLRLVSVDPVFASITNTSYISISPQGMKMVGTAKLCRPPFPWARTTIENYLNGVEEVQRDRPLADLVLHQRADTIFMYEPGTVQYVLSQQIEGDTGFRIAYVMTTTGPVILSRVTETDVMDMAYYEKINADNLRALRRLPRHI